MSFETISLLLSWVELGVLLAILLRLGRTFELIAGTQRELRRADSSFGRATRRPARCDERARRSRHRVAFPLSTRPRRCCDRNGQRRFWPVVCREISGPIPYPVARALCRRRFAFRLALRLLARMVLLDLEVLLIFGSEVGESLELSLHTSPLQ